MHYLTRICCLCLNNSDGISSNIFKTGEDNKTYYEKITTSLPNVVFNKNHDDFMLCIKCCGNIDLVYEFNHTCSRNLNTFLSYKEKLCALSNEGGVPIVNVIDIGEKAIDYKKCFDQDKMAKQEMDVKVQGNDTRHERTRCIFDVKVEPLDIDDDCIKKFACLESDSNIDLRMEHIQDVKTEVEDFGGAMDVLTEEDILEDEFAYSEIKIEENDIKVECFGGGADGVFNSLGIINDDHLVHDQLEECTKINKTTGNKTTTRYELRHSRGAHSYAVINGGSTNDDLNVTSPVNHSKASSDTSSSGVDDFSIHSTSEDEGSEESSSLIAYSLAHPSYVCDVCDITFMNSRNLVSHKVVHTNQKPHVCDICKKRFSRSYSLSIHKRIHTGQRPYFCAICKNKLSEASTLARHKLIHAGQQLLVCDICKINYDDAKNLARHKLIHTGQKPHDCGICKKAFSQPGNLATHKLIHTGQKPHVCGICKKAFSLLGNLATHKLIHTGQKPHVCDICKKAFSQKSTLATHKLIHTGQKPHVCGICKKAFGLPGNLATHKLIHTGQKPHVCDICKKAFTQASNLARHKLIHTGQKPHVCGICKKAFSQPGNLATHKLIHTGQKPHVCGICKKAFSLLGNLATHKLIHTDKKPHVSVKTFVKRNSSALTKH